MKKRFSCLFLCLLFTLHCRSQDTMTTSSGELIYAVIAGVSDDLVQYRQPPDTILQTLPKAQIDVISYADGHRDDLKSERQNAASMMQFRGRSDATMNYEAKNSGKGWTGATTIILTPLVGLIPALACSARPPSDGNLLYPVSDMMNQPVYARAYREQAHRIKRQAIWKSYRRCTLVWLSLLLTQAMLR
jgi:hypothetical protein